MTFKKEEKCVYHTIDKDIYPKFYILIRREFGNGIKVEYKNNKNNKYNLSENVAKDVDDVLFFRQNYMNRHPQMFPVCCKCKVRDKEKLKYYMIVSKDSFTTSMMTSYHPGYGWVKNYASKDMLDKIDKLLLKYLVSI